jgi:hypothetical protein
MAWKGKQLVSNVPKVSGSLVQDHDRRSDECDRGNDQPQLKLTIPVLQDARIWD